MIPVHLEEFGTHSPAGHISITTKNTAAASTGNLSVWPCAEYLEKPLLAGDYNTLRERDHPAAFQRL